MSYLNINPQNSVYGIALGVVLGLIIFIIFAAIVALITVSLLFTCPGAIKAGETVGPEVNIYEVLNE